MRIATWNLAKPRRPGKKWHALEQQLHAIGADVWILTETNSQLSPGLAYSGWHTTPIEEYHHGPECRTSIWTKLQVVRQISVLDAETCVCVELESQYGPMLVFGAVIPYQGAGVGERKYRSNMRWHTGQAAWALHLASIERHHKELVRLRSEHANKHFIFAGDFNHHRYPGSGYGRVACRNLTSCLVDAEIQCVTEADYRKLGQLSFRSTVDHICLSRGLVDRGVNTEAWDAPFGKSVSDHNGVTVDITSLG